MFNKSYALSLSLSLSYFDSRYLRVYSRACRIYMLSGNLPPDNCKGSVIVFVCGRCNILALRLELFHPAVPEVVSLGSS